MSKKTLYDKLWSDHLVYQAPGSDSSLIYIDRHLIHEVTSPQAFDGLRLANRKVWRKQSVLATPDHNVPTDYSSEDVKDPISRIQVSTLQDNCEEFDLVFYGMNDPRQGIVHVIGPEQGATLPGMTIVCGDSHTSTHGAFAVLAMGIGTSEVEHVLATQCLNMKKMKNMRIQIDGQVGFGISAKDIVLAIIGKIGVAGGTGYVFEYAGEAIRNLSMEGRMTVCNMSIEAGARAGMMAFDEITEQYLYNRPWTPRGKSWKQAVAQWQELHSDSDAVFDRKEQISAPSIAPQVTWGTSPEMVVSITDRIPDPDKEVDTTKAQGMRNALQYMGLKAGTAMQDISLDKIFIGSCTNGRIEDLRVAAQVVAGKRVAGNIKQALVVPGSGLVKQMAEKEGLDKIFTQAGFEWRGPGCSMCLAMNDDRLGKGERCASTSNRNFEGRQGQGGRTHLLSPAMVAASAIAGHFVDVRKLV